MNLLRQGYGVIAVCEDGIKRFGTIDGWIKEYGEMYYGVSFNSKRRIEFVHESLIDLIYTIGDGFGILYDSNPYHYPCKFADYDWKLKVTNLNQSRELNKVDNSKFWEKHLGTA